MGALVLTIPGVMRGKQRPRSAVRGRFATIYTPKETVIAESWVKQCCVDQIGTPCLEGALAVSIGISVAIPASWSKKKQAAALEGSINPTGKPDIDNTCKLIFDALNTILWRDDSQIVRLTIGKGYARSPVTVLMVEVL